ncbi:Uncharacterized protein APZ42_022553 [Daphnia magna]|uniref:Uncharacterized protein n=1 Tax=Daphnia magna TaxID=35525 RepID=A0A164VKY3_9CRUS|nr:Uncharacterized protein APZ42_022553 [Daphnia magna]
MCAYVWLVYSSLPNSFPPPHLRPLHTIQMFDAISEMRKCADVGGYEGHSQISVFFS